MVKNPPANAGDAQTQVHSLGWEDPLESEMATCSNILAWKIPWTEQPGGLHPLGSQSVGQDKSIQTDGRDHKPDQQKNLPVNPHD